MQETLFFAQVARWKLVLCGGAEIDAKVIQDKAMEYYSTDKYHFNIQSDKMFQGIHVSIMHSCEYIYKLRINVYEIHSLKKTHMKRQNKYVEGVIVYIKW